MALYLQNVPQFVIGLVGTWKTGGVAVSINPMNRARELEELLCDSGATVLVCLRSLYRDVAAGVVGGTFGPQVVAGYWNKPEETANAIPGGALHTGDVGYMDDQGWFYIVDRKKDQINAGGYKVWPREVEDVLYEHEAVREAAVVGVADDCRGETVKAFVSLRAGHRVTDAELIAFAKDRMAAYKYPRSIEFLDEIPKTVTGKLLRRELRAREQ